MVTRLPLYGAYYKHHWMLGLAALAEQKTAGTNIRPGFLGDYMVSFCGVFRFELGLVNLQR